jgi:hypothetical protein
VDAGVSEFLTRRRTDIQADREAVWRITYLQPLLHLIDHLPTFILLG